MSRPRLLAVAALSVVPWSFVDAGGAVTLVFPFGLVNFGPFGLLDVVSYVTVATRGLPQYLLAWPIGVLLYCLALASAAAGCLGREDRRVTAVLLVLVGLTQVSMAWGLTRRLDTVALPVGAVLCWAVVWWFDWATLRGLAPAVGPQRRGP